MGRMRSLTLVWLLLAAGAAAQEPTPSPSPSPPSGTFHAGPFAFGLGGRIKLDAIHDFDAIGSTDSFDPRTIPTDGAEATNTRLHARETRLSLDVTGPVEGRELKLYVEGDFYGSGNAFRLRHAYGRYGGLLAGQTWSTFMDEDNIPNTIDFETPEAYALARLGLVRFTTRVSRRASLSFAVEDGNAQVVPPPGVTGAQEKPLPDLVTRLRFTSGHGHLQLSGSVGKARFRPNAGQHIDVTLWGVLGSARIPTAARDAAYAQVAYGPGVAHYRSGIAVAPDASGRLDAVEAIGLMGGYEHYWSRRWSSNAVYSVAKALNALGDPATTNKRLDYVAVNLLFWFLDQRAWAGAEYLHGQREVRSGAHGAANRVQFAVRFNIPG